MYGVLGIDLGTSSVKALLLDAQGQVMARGEASYELLTPHPGWVEQEPHTWWQAVCKAVQELIATGQIKPEWVRGIGFSGQLNGAVCLDAQGQVLRPAPIWLDHRSTAECEWGNAQAGELLKSRALSRLSPVNTLAKVLWLARHEPQLYRQINTILLHKFKNMKEGLLKIQHLQNLHLMN